ncbi:transposase [Saccharothrix isguenensis]
MAPPKKYPDELRERATRMVVEDRRDPAAATGAIKRIADQLGIHPEALRTWVKRAEIDAGDRPGTTSGDAELLAELERENRELRRANRTILVESSATRGFAMSGHRHADHHRLVIDILAHQHIQIRVKKAHWRKPSEVFTELLEADASTA